MLTVKNDSFYLNEQPFQILSGGIHYFRTVPEQWEDRLQKLKALGLNTVETYIPWNFHEPKKGEFNFKGMADIERFIELAHKLGLYVILRPAPYICAEWEMGGLPSWLMKEKGLVMRSSHFAFLKHVDEYFAELLPKFKKHLLQNGGPVIAMQIENEYGAYGNDLEYLAFYRDQYEKHGLDTFLFTSDGPDFITQGSIPDVTTTLNFGSRVDESFDALEAFKSGSPKMVAEFWIGWFDYWTGEHTVRSGDDVAAVFKEIMEKNISVNFYMFHGGTNFGFMNGANHYDIYYPTITSYDYDSLLTEGGAITEKYKAVKKVLSEFTEVPADFEETVSAKDYGTVTVSESVSLFDVLDSISEKVEHIVPLPMEDIGQAYGYTLYRTTVNRQGELKFNSGNIRDRSSIYVNGRFAAKTYINDEDKTVTLDFPEKVNTLEIFVENMGRANYGEHLTDPKGLIKNLWLGEQYFFHWEMFKVEMDRLPADYQLSGSDRYPKFFRGSFDAAEGLDTYVDTAGFTKGNVFINGFNLGRYWNEAGPQQRLYLPGPLLKKENNEIVVLELENTATDKIQLLAQPKLS
ncbi:glycoside hydrolase family 35 protein [Planococcus sp. NCCP-2050]|uniref:glycoside hydrolase family 35 protein n=1 Tax=Planococcus sp. NCCP-2050 TaxID=2944679 RepID=UPI00203FA9AF|nr:glycoside hydrolase family 35 protein [Planococcus sp. NCCP-2050]GKW47036.1 beta-galactosidase [Planococcus sp. NCCP-2050]